MTTLYARFAAHVDAALDALIAEGATPALPARGNVTIEPPRDASHGDLATNAAMVLAKPAGMNPRALAELLVGRLGAVPEVASAEIAGPGFINLRLTEDCWRAELQAIHAEGADYGRSLLGGGRTVNVEYVSANPTGPMHMGHCRGAVVGDALANVLSWTGHKVVREYYVNDAGGQVDVLARSAHLRYREALGEDIGAIPEGLYPGDYLIPVGNALAAEFGDKYAKAPEPDWLALFRERASGAMMELIRDDLAQLGVHHDIFTSEKAIQDADRVNQMFAELEKRDLVYTGTLEAPRGYVDEDWEPRPLLLFKSQQFGDDGDRPLKKPSGEWTYFANDIAYHFDKAGRSDALINIWGADHVGTVKRIKAAVAALTDNKTEFDIPMVQMVRLMRNGELVRMGKRLGNFVTLSDMVDEVGKDVVRFTMLTRKADAQMDFDFAKVVEASKDNPVFYVQYAHARICSILRKAEGEGLAPKADVSLLDATDLELVKLAAQFPRIVMQAAANHEPHRIAFYLYDLAAAFHAYYNLGNDQLDRRILMVNSPEITSSRLFMCVAIRQIIANGLSIMGVRAAEEM